MTRCWTALAVISGCAGTGIVRCRPVGDRPTRTDSWRAWPGGIGEGLPKHEVYGNLLQLWPGCFPSVEAAIASRRRLLGRFSDLDSRTRRLLLRLRCAGVPTAVVTNGTSASQRLKVRHSGLAELVDAIVVSEEFGAAKPAAAIFRHAAATGWSGPGAHAVRRRPSGGGHRRRARSRHADRMDSPWATMGSRRATARLRGRRGRGKSATCSASPCRPDTPGNPASHRQWREARLAGRSEPGCIAACNTTGVRHG